MTTDFPWFPCYPDDFHGSRKTKTMDATQVGIYWLLLMDEWRNGPLPDDDIELAQIGRESCGKVREVLQKCFTMGAGGWTNRKLEAIRAEQEQKRKKRVNAGRRGGYAKAERKKSSNATAMPQQCSSKALAKGYQPEPEEEPEDSTPTVSDESLEECGKLEWGDFVAWFKTEGCRLLWQADKPPSWAPKGWTFERDLSVIRQLEAKGELLEDIQEVIKRTRAPTCMLHFNQRDRWDHWHRAKADMLEARKIDLRRVGIEITAPKKPPKRTSRIALTPQHAVSFNDGDS